MIDDLMLIFYSNLDLLAMIYLFSSSFSFILAVLIYLFAASEELSLSDRKFDI